MADDDRHVALDEVVTSPRSKNAVQIPPEADGTGNDTLDLLTKGQTPNEQLDALPADPDVKPDSEPEPSDDQS